MTASDTQHPSSQTIIANETFGQKCARWIEDPFASVIAGIIAPTFAVAFLLSAMYGLSGLLA